MTISKTWAKPELKQLSVDQTLSASVPGFTETLDNGTLVGGVGGDAPLS